MKKVMKVVATSMILGGMILFTCVNNIKATTEQSNRFKEVKTKEIAGKALETTEIIIVNNDNISTDTSVTEEEINYISVEEVLEKMNFSMNLGESCGLSKEDFVKLMEELPYDYTGFYERNAEFIWEMEQEYNVNAIFICGIIAQESGWAQYDACLNNYTGTMGSNGYASFESEEEGIEYTFNNLQNGYISKDLTTVSSIAPTYVGYSGSGWDSNVFSAMKMIIKSGC